MPWKLLFLTTIIALLSGCATQSAVDTPDATSIGARRLSPSDLEQLPRSPTRIYAGDTLRIVRDGQDVAALDIRNLVEDSQTQQYTVRSDGTLSYRYVGRIQAAGQTPDELASLMRSKLEPIYRDPGVTINIVASPSSKVVIGGAVAAPAAFDINSVATLEQALFAAGGLLNSADNRSIALLRLDARERYQAYFIDLHDLLTPTEPGRSTVALQRGDIVFVPKSTAGKAADFVDLYINQLLPFTRSIGASYSKNVN